MAPATREPSLMSARMLATMALVVVCIGSHAQNRPQRSNLGAAGGSVIRSVNGKSFYLQQSVGQASVAGSYQVDGRYFNQGFVQPFHKAVQGLPSTDLDALLFPNPFTDQFTIAFAEEPSGPVTVQVYNAMGQAVYAQEHAPQHAIMIQPGPLAAGAYIVRILVGHRRFAGHLQHFH